MRSFPPDIWADLEKLLSTNAVVWHAAIEPSPGQAFFLVANTDPVTYLGLTWMPYPFTVSGVQSNADGEFRQVSLTLSNVGRMLAPFVEAGNWKPSLGGGHVSLLLSWLGDTTLETGFRLDFQIQNITTRASRVVLQLGQPNFLSRQFPGERYLRAKYRGIPRA